MSELDPNSPEFRRAQDIAWRQIQNKARGIPLDYQAIMEYRQVLPDHFEDLPSDEECKRQLGIVSKGRK